MSKTFYIGCWEPYRELVARITLELAALGWDSTYDWSMAVPHGELSELASRHLEGVMDADAFVFLVPSGRTAHTELGIAIALGKAVVIAYEEPDKLLGANALDALYYYEASVTRWQYYGPLYTHLLAALLDKLLLRKMMEVTEMITSPGKKVDD